MTCTASPVKYFVLGILHCGLCSHDNVLHFKIYSDLFSRQPLFKLQVLEWFDNSESF
jgi:hypothetical protein